MAVLTCTNLVPIFVLLFKFKLKFDGIYTAFWFIANRL